MLFQGTFFLACLRHIHVIDYFFNRRSLSPVFYFRKKIWMDILAKKFGTYYYEKRPGYQGQASGSNRQFHPNFAEARLMKLLILLATARIRQHLPPKVWKKLYIQQSDVNSCNYRRRHDKPITGLLDALVFLALVSLFGRSLSSWQVLPFDDSKTCFARIGNSLTEDISL